MAGGERGGERNSESKVAAGGAGWVDCKSCCVWREEFETVALMIVFLILIAFLAFFARVVWELWKVRRGLK
jgi:hypothetical protein